MAAPLFPRHFALHLPLRECLPEPTKVCGRSPASPVAQASAPRLAHPPGAATCPETMTPFPVSRMAASIAAREVPASMAQIVLVQIDSGASQRLGVVPTDTAVARNVNPCIDPLRCYGSEG